MSTVDLDRLREAVGRQFTTADTITRTQIRGLWATLDRDPDLIAPDHPLPALAHWLFCQEQAPQGALGEDGHLAKGRFLPDLPYPRRMWAGSRIRFDGALRVGDEIERTSTLASIDHKEGRRGPLLLITIEHTTTGPNGSIREEQDLVYLEVPTEPMALEPAPVEVEGETEVVVPTSSMLFRFSALTFNAHKIHYDQDFTRNVELYPDLVVHGPLTALLLADFACRRNDRRLREFAFRARRPMFVDRPITLAGTASDDAMELSALDDTRSLTLTATACFAGV